MKGFCPSCEKETELVHIHGIEEINIKGENIPVEIDRFKCKECGEEFDNPDPSYDPLAEAYREYRHRKGMVTGEQIHAFRERYCLSQKEFGDLIGFGSASISRYENGTLQDEAHATALRLILDASNFLKIIEEKPDVLDRVKREKIINLLKFECNSSDLFNLFKTRGSGNYNKPSILNGYRTIDIRKVLCVVQILVSNLRVYKTKLNKLLFYADFKHYKDQTISITGLNYAHLPYGPVPDQYELLYESLLAVDPYLKKEEDATLDYSGEYFSYEQEPDHSILTIAEINTLLQIKEFFRKYTSKEIVEFSHSEIGYQATQNGEIISYEFAESLKI